MKAYVKRIEFYTRLMFHGTYVAPEKAKHYKQTDKVTSMWRFTSFEPQKHTGYAKHSFTISEI